MTANSKYPSEPKAIVAITGGYLSQNMGATAMTIVAAERISQSGYGIELFSKYPDDDRAFAVRYGVALRPTRQIFYALLIMLLLVTAWIPPVRAWIRSKYFRDIVAFYDVGGITFSDSRGFIGYLINLTWLLVPLLLRLPLIKGSQAMGPFTRWYLRLTLPLLRKVRFIYARGSESERFLRAANIPCEAAPDIAFLLKTEPAPLPDGPFIAVVPSSVVMRHYDGAHGPGAYIKLLTDIIHRITDSARKVVVLAHSYRKEGTLNNNDFPIAQHLVEQAASPHVELYDVFGKTPGQLKFVLGHSDVVLTSRFHAMIAAIDSCVPVVVASWSHKYREVLEAFDLGQWSVPWKDATADVLSERILAACAEHGAISAKIGRSLSHVRLQAERNFQHVSHLL